VNDGAVQARQCLFLRRMEVRDHREDLAGKLIKPLAGDPRVAADSQKALVKQDPEKLTVKSTVQGGAKDFWYFFEWNGFRPRAQGLDQPVTFPGEVASSTASSTSPTPVVVDTVKPTLPAQPPTPGFSVSFAALLSPEKAQQLASTINVGGTVAHVVTTTTAGSLIYRVVLGPYPTRDEAVKVGRASRREYWVYEGSP